MVLKKSDLPDMPPDVEEKMKVAEAAIDDNIRRSYMAGQRLNIDTFMRGLPHNLQKKIMEKYEAAGWKVEFHDDQRDGSYITIE